MPRPERRCRGGRVTPKGTRPAKRRGELPCGCPTAEELLLRDASDAVASYTALDEAEVWASSIQALFHPGGLACGHALSPSRVLAAAEDCDDTAAAAAVAAAVTVYGPRGHRSRACGLLRRLDDEGAPMPPWADELGRVTPLRAVLMTDSWGDHRTVWIDFKRPDAAVRGVGVELHAAPDGPEYDLLYGPPIEHLACGADVHPHTGLADISLADARATVEAGLKMHDRQARLRKIELAEALDNSLRALVDQRIALLPTGGASHHRGAPTRRDAARLCADFVAACPPEHAQDAKSVFEDICRFASAWGDGDPLCWSPCRVNQYLSGWVPARADRRDHHPDVLECLFPLWLRFAGERRSLTENLQELSLRKARDVFNNAGSADPTDGGAAPSTAAEMIAAGIDPHDLDAVRDWLQSYYSRFGHERH